MKLYDALVQLFENEVSKAVFSKPRYKTQMYKKYVLEKKDDFYQVTCFTEKQAFHKNFSFAQTRNLSEFLSEGEFRQINAWTPGKEHIYLVSKSGDLNYKVKSSNIFDALNTQHNREKKYLLEKGKIIPPLIDMGVISADGKVIDSMYDKYKQINRFLEIISDEMSKIDKDELNIIDFGCGKSYLTFVLYYYLKFNLNKNVNILGLDLKKEVIDKCNEAAFKYGYDSLKFEVGDIKGYEAPFKVDAVISLHACDTATDYAIYNAIKWGAENIFAVPCCQHELNGQIKSKSFKILSRYGLIKERFSSLATDAIRSNILEICGYKVQVLEFVDFEHTPKNILIRAVKRKKRNKRLEDDAKCEVEKLISEFNFSPTLYKLVNDSW